MAEYDFDTIIDRSGTNSVKWEFAGRIDKKLDAETLPLWVADMDFRSPPAVIDALHKRVDHGIFGYTFHVPELADTLVSRMKHRYGWEIQAEDMLFSPGLVLGLGLVTQAVGKPGDGVLMTPPVYGPFLTRPGIYQRFAEMVDMIYVQDDASTFHYEIDFDAFEKAASNPQVTMFMLCNPHNPGGRVFTREELERFAEICLKHDLIICADEIHSDLVLEGTHIPIASLSPEVADRTITLIAPSKTFNLAGLAASVMIVTNEDMRNKLNGIMWSSGAHVNLLGLTAAHAAYAHGDGWLKALLTYLKGNRDYMVQYIRDNIPGLRIASPEGTYLAWLDCRELPLEKTPQDFFLDEANIALNGGAFFGQDYDQFVRLNFGTPRAILIDALDRMRTAITKLGVTS